MRQMKNGNTVLKVIRHIILRNFWEYYVTEMNKDGICFGLVMGFETELGSFSLDEIRPYIISSTTDLEDIMSAPGWKWVD